MNKNDIENINKNDIIHKNENGKCIVKKCQNKATIGLIIGQNFNNNTKKYEKYLLHHICCSEHTEVMKHIIKKD